MRSVFPIRLAIVEKAKICRAAVLRRLTPSAYVRWAALEQADRDLAPDAGGLASDAASLSFSRENLGAGLRSASPQRTPPRQSEADESSDEPGVPAEWMRERVEQGLPDGATFEEWKSGGVPPGGAMRE